MFFYLNYLSSDRLVLPNRTFYFVANSVEEADEWKNLLHWKIVSF